MNLSEQIIQAAEKSIKTGQEVKLVAQKPYPGKRFRHENGVKGRLAELGVTMSWDGLTKTYTLTPSKQTPKTPSKPTLKTEKPKDKKLPFSYKGMTVKSWKENPTDK